MVVAAALEAAVMCMALNIYHEVRGEPLDCQFAVAQATLNRADRKPEQVCEVVQKYKQFSWTLKPPPVTDMVAWKQSQTVARLSFYMSDFTNGTTHYHTITVSPYWKSDMVVTGQCGNHILYKQKGKR